MSDAVDAVLADLAAEVTPDADEREAMWAAVSALTDRLEAAIDELGLDAEVLHVGSTARDTWLAGERDIDLFVRFPADIDRGTLREHGLRVGRAVLADGRARYAEHPYISGSWDGFDVDVVPCVAVEDASVARTAVDRTPFHNAYVTDRLDDDRAAEVRIAKQLLSQIDAYGSNLRTRGFGGYLLELLVLEHGGARGLVEAATDWTPPVELDPAEHGRGGFDDPLVVIDPTDPDRNVAAVVSPRNLARLQHYARAFLAEPARESFALPPVEPISEAGLVTELEDRGTAAVALTFARPDVVDDQLYPQLEKTHHGVRDALDREGFAVCRSATLVADDALAILLECAVGRLPAVERHAGPPVHMRAHAEDFLAGYGDAEGYGPFIEGDRYVVERERTHRTPRSFLASEALLGVRIGDDLRAVIEDDHDVLVDEELTALVPAFDEALARYFEPVP